MSGFGNTQPNQKEVGRMADTDSVRMVHPDLPDAAVDVAREAFDGCWSALGWQIDKPAKNAPTAKKEK